ncbi:MAG: phospholipase D-like domain-containing protein [Bdellovibrionota bacterium]
MTKNPHKILQLNINELTAALAVLLAFTPSVAHSQLSTTTTSVAVAYAPNNSRELTVSAIASARQTIELNIYELSSPAIRDALIDRIRAGVRVRILEEGQPVSGMSCPGRQVQADLVTTIERNPKSKSQFFEMTSKAGGDRRFRFNHAKYTVIDGISVVVGSENYSPTGQPAPGAEGNRGWEVRVYGEKIASQYQTLFHADSDVSFKDVRELTDSKALMKELKKTCPKQESGLSEETVRVRSAPAAGRVSPILSAQEVIPFTSPENSLQQTLEIVRSATRTLDIQQMSFSDGWDGDEYSSPMISELLDAAQRGVRVRVLLNDDRVFVGSGPKKTQNQRTSAYLNRLAGQRRVTLRSQIANLKKMDVDYIHNKGILADGALTLVSSINWTQNSITNNRETAVALYSESIFNYYENIFEADWSVSTLRAAIKSIWEAPGSEIWTFSGDR